MADEKNETPEERWISVTFGNDNRELAIKRLPDSWFHFTFSRPLDAIEKKEIAPVFTEVGGRLITQLAFSPEAVEAWRNLLNKIAESEEKTET